MTLRSRFTGTSSLATAALLFSVSTVAFGHGTLVQPVTRVWRVFQSNPEQPDFPLAAQAIATDGTNSYYTWMELTRFVPEAVQAGLPPGFDYSPFIPDEQLASGGRTDPNSAEYQRTYAGLDQVSADWPKTPVNAGTTYQVDFLAHTPHDPSVWDVWMTTPDWTPDMPLTWDKMEFLERPSQVSLIDGHYLFDIEIPTDRSGHHVLYIIWQRDDPVGEAFFQASDIDIKNPAELGTSYCLAAANSVEPAGALISLSGSASVAANDLTLSADPIGAGQIGIFFHGEERAFVPFGEGFRCIDGGIVRIPPPSAADGAGTLGRLFDLMGPGSSPVAPGVTRHFQAWYRDPAGGPNGFNLSNGITLTFEP